MTKRKKIKIAQGEAVRLFAERLREVRLSRGMTQADLAHDAHISETYVGRLERAEAAPGIDLVARLAQALHTTSANLLPSVAAPETRDFLKEQATRLFEKLIQKADRDTLLLLCPLLRLLSDAK